MIVTTLSADYTTSTSYNDGLSDCVGIRFYDEDMVEMTFIIFGKDTKSRDLM